MTLHELIWYLHAAGIRMRARFVGSRVDHVAPLQDKTRVTAAYTYSLTPLRFLTAFMNVSCTTG